MSYMAQGRKSTAGRRNKRDIQKSRPTAAAQKRQIHSTQRQVDAIKTKLREIREPCTWTMGFERVPLVAVTTSSPFVVPLTSGPTTNTGANAAVVNNAALTSCQWKYTMSPFPQNSPDNRSKAFLGSQYVDFSIESGTETATQRYTIYLVSLQPDTARETYNSTTSMSVLVRDQHYCCPDKSATSDPSMYGVYLNPRMFRIHKKFICQTQSTPDDSISSVARGVGNRNNQTNRFIFKTSYGNAKLVSPGDNNANSASPSMDLDQLTYRDINPHLKKFLIICTDDTNGNVLNSTLSLSSVISGSTA